MDTLEKYVRTSGCAMNECPYGDKTLCTTCIRRMVEEHDAKIIADFTNKLLDTLCNGYCYPTQSFEDGVIEVVKDAIHDIEQKEQKEYTRLTLDVAIQTLGEYKKLLKEQSND